MTGIVTGHTCGQASGHAKPPCGMALGASARPAGLIGPRKRAAGNVAASCDGPRERSARAAWESRSEGARPSAHPTLRHATHTRLTRPRAFARLGYGKGVGVLLRPWSGEAPFLCPAIMRLGARLVKVSRGARHAIHGLSQLCGEWLR
jgi:hypothetical protein